MSGTSGRNTPRSAPRAFITARPPRWNAPPRAAKCATLTIRRRPPVTCASAFAVNGAFLIRVGSRPSLDCAGVVTAHPTAHTSCEPAHSHLRSQSKCTIRGRYSEPVTLTSTRQFGAQCVCEQRGDDGRKSNARCSSRSRAGSAMAPAATATRANQAALADRGIAAKQAGGAPKQRKRRSRRSGDCSTGRETPSLRAGARQRRRAARLGAPENTAPPPSAYHQRFGTSVEAPMAASWTPRKVGRSRFRPLAALVRARRRPAAARGAGLFR